MKYRKKPVVIEAFEWSGGSEDPEWFQEAIDEGLVEVVLPEAGPGRAYLRIKTLEGTMIADYGDYIIRGIKGELYPCKPDIFKATYELVEDLRDEH